MLAGPDGCRGSMRWPWRPTTYDIRLAALSTLAALPPASVAPTPLALIAAGPGGAGVAPGGGRGGLHKRIAEALPVLAGQGWRPRTRGARAEALVALGADEAVLIAALETDGAGDRGGGPRHGGGRAAVAAAAPERRGEGSGAGPRGDGWGGWPPGSARSRTAASSR
ncbi:MAG: hypothetical protein R3F43_21060 [bacterium]